ncbi:hypothetical protein IC608_09370 [Devosia sp. PTR5]|uniref:Yip1 domain-containing protein n=1 Tax=Devosia oryzisoli TaxID=2774138 RepID=A0A927FVN3_9HYPH|nr:hypothetical protein [Devosia oryzisoli]MBD8065683.1 hypothetical protein [Devosia oryzisoli]
MKSLNLLREAVAGWVGIVRGDPTWADHFHRTPAGLSSAIALFAVLAFLAIALASLGVGVPALWGFVAAMLVQALSLVALFAATYGTRLAVPSGRPVLDTLVPGVYALIFYLVAGIALSMFGGPLLILLWLGLVILLFRLGRAAAGWPIGVAAAFAVLTLVLLVGMPLILYMLTGPVAAPAP